MMPSFIKFEFGYGTYTDGQEALELVVMGSDWLVSAHMVEHLSHRRTVDVSSLV